MTSPAPHTYGIHRQDLQAAMAKAEELRALHAALMSGGAAASSPAVHNLAAGPPPFLLPRATSSFPAEDYPVFTPSYEDFRPSWAPSDSISRAGLEGEYFHNKEVNPCRMMNKEDLLFQAAETQLFPDSSSLRRRSPGTETIESSRRLVPDESKAVTASRRCRPGETHLENYREKNAMDSQKNRGAMLSRIFPRFRRKPKSEMSPNTLENEEMSQLFKDWGICSLETLKRELMEANENRDLAVAEVSEMKSAMEELRRKLGHLESYCEELKKSLKQATQGKDAAFRRGKPSNDDEDGGMPVSHEAMVEGFLQIASEARLSVRQFCKILITQVEETDSLLMETLEILLRPFNLSMNCRNSKILLIHFEAIINRVFFEDFENCGFERNGSPKAFDPRQNRMESFSAFAALRNLTSSKALRKGTRSYCEDFNRFCDRKRRSTVSVLGWSTPWADHLTQSFFVAAKCVWLLHLLAFSFYPPLTIMRVNEHRSFDPAFMEDALPDRHKVNGQSQVKVMVAPGFYVEERVLKCKVICRHKTGSQRMTS